MALGLLEVVLVMALVVILGLVLELEMPFDMLQPKEQAPGTVK